MTHPNDIAQQVVDDIKEAPTVVAALGTGKLGTGAVADYVTRYDDTVRATFLQALQDLEAPGALVAVENVTEGPGSGAWWVTTIGVYLRIGEGGDYATFLRELVMHKVDGDPWHHRCLIEDQTDQPSSFRMTREVYGTDLEIQVIRFQVVDKEP